MLKTDFTFTKDQTLALMRDRHLVVTANAGSGKTSVLVEKYLDLLLHLRKKKPYDAIRSIVAITFTRQAAGDMKAKITSKISKRMIEDPGNLKMWKQLREQISSAKVSTIHSFCNSLLRDYPVEAEISPVFREMDEYESNYFAEFAVDSIIDDYSSALQNGNFDENIENYAELLTSVSISKLRQFLVQIVKEPVLLRSLKDFYNNNPEETYQIYLTIFKEYFKNNINEIAEIFNNSHDVIESSVKNYHEIKIAIDTFTDHVKNKDFDISLAIIYLKIIHNLKVGNKKLTNFIVDAYFSNTAKKTEYRDKIKEILEININYLDGNDDSSLYLKNIYSFVELALEADARLWEMKHEQSAYTFDDLLILALRLMENDEVRGKIIKDLDFLMVDEFQDTNHIQYDMVRRLVPQLADTDYKDSPKVFIVGDAKQSIYGFRSADVSVFNQAQTDIESFNRAAVNEKRLSRSPYIFDKFQDVSDSQSWGRISLADTFRLLPAVAHFTNAVCSNLFDSKKSGISYEKLVCGRSLIHPLTNDDIITHENGAIKFLVAIKPRKDESHESDIYPSEENLTADYIQNIIKGKSVLKIHNGSEYINPNYKDIAILCRKKSSIQKLSKVFIEKKIPYSIVSGKGFYQTQEISDFLSLLNFITNQNDDIGIAGVLKSPMFNLNDGELMNIARQKGSTFFEKFKSYQTDVADSAFFINRARIILQELIDISSVLSVSELIIKIIELTDYFGAIEKFDAREQIKSNISRLIESAREFESKGYKSLYEFIRRAYSLIDFSSEAEAAFISDDNVVRIMTVHASKGLEFPVVILFDSNSRGSADSGIIKSKNLGISLPMMLPANSGEGEKFILNSADTVVQKVVKDVKSNDDLAEEARLLYVAMTRAKYHLIISATLRQTQKSYSLEKKSFFGLITKSIDKSIDLFAEQDNITITDILDFTEGENLNLIQKIEIIRECTGFDNVKVISDIQFENIFENNLDYYTNKICPENRFDILSATKYSIFLNDFDSFSKRYILGLPDKPNFIADYDTPDENEKFEEVQKADGTLYGSIIHRICERINEWCSDAKSENYNSLELVINQTLEEFNQTDNDSIIERANRESNMILKNHFIQENFDNFQYSEFEKELNMPLAGSIITGNIDLLLKNHDNSIIEVWDWKSNHVTDKNDADKLLEHYRPQLELYLYLISKLYQQKERYTGRLLFTMAADIDYFMTEISLSQKDIDNFEKQFTEKLFEIKSY
ncbi:MAG: UvrD-helicase domain-containing protein [Candidatus Kapabacteria bacterium]|nr:UvrD-helicase domain-containing protein [Ignavibacteriota bacterium]MCW5884812.1 UvrD-helicase domain-containing protein [Candidatus Kapabacteria bacterium]